MNPSETHAANEFLWWFASMGNFYNKNRLLEWFIGSSGQHSNPHSIGPLHHNTETVPLRHCGGILIHILVKYSSILLSVFLFSVLIWFCMEYVIINIVFMNFKQFSLVTILFIPSRKMMFWWTLQAYKLKIWTLSDATHSSDYYIIHFDSCQHSKIAQKHKGRKTVCIHSFT